MKIRHICGVNSLNKLSSSQISRSDQCKVASLVREFYIRIESRAVLSTTTSLCLRFGCGRSGTRFSAFLDGPEKFSQPKSRSKISDLVTKELFYAHTLNMSRGSLHTRTFRRKHLSVFKYRLTEIGFVGPKSFRGYRETGLWAQDKCHDFWCKKILLNYCLFELAHCNRRIIATFCRG